MYSIFQSSYCMFYSTCFTYFAPPVLYVLLDMCQCFTRHISHVSIYMDSLFLSTCIAYLLYMYCMFQSAYSIFRSKYSTCFTLHVMMYSMFQSTCIANLTLHASHVSIYMVCMFQSACFACFNLFV